MKKIILTALESHWGTPEDSCFLGEWCMLQPRREKWEIYDTKVLAPILDDDEVQKKNIEYVVELGEQAVKEIGSLLNEKYGLNQTERFFKIILYSWTLYFTGALFSRYTSIKQACEVLSEPCFITCPTTPLYPPYYKPSESLSQLLLSDEYNLFTFSQIVHSLGLKYEEREMCFPQGEVAVRQKNMSSLKRRLMLSVGYTINRIFGRDFYNAGNLYAYNTARQLFYQTQGRILEDTCEKWPDIRVNINYDLRKQYLSLGEGEFPELLGKLLLSHLPWGLFEGMLAHVRAAKKHPARKAKAFITSQDLYNNLPWMYTAAISGSPISLVSHGPDSSAYANNVSLGNVIENNHSDKRFEVNAGEKSLPKLSYYNFAESTNGVQSKTEKQVLFIYSPWVRYPRLHGRVSKNREYHARQLQLFKLISLDIPISYRKFFLDTGVEDFNSIQAVCPNVTLQDPHSVPFGKAVVESSICLMDNCWHSLAAFEVLVARKPCILIYHSDIMSTSPLMQQVMDVLVKAGIMHYDVNSAAEQMNKIFYDIEGWWNTAQVQEALDLFIHSFAPPINHWPQKYYAALKQLSAEFKNK